MVQGRCQPSDVDQLYGCLQVPAALTKYVIRGVAWHVWKRNTNFDYLRPALGNLVLKLYRLRST